MEIKKMVHRIYYNHEVKCEMDDGTDYHMYVAEGQEFKNGMTRAEILSKKPIAEIKEQVYAELFYDAHKKIEISVEKFDLVMRTFAFYAEVSYGTIVPTKFAEILYENRPFVETRREMTVGEYQDYLNLATPHEIASTMFDLLGNNGLDAGYVITH